MTIYVPHSIRGVQVITRVVSVSGTLKIHENIFSTGELDSIEQSMANEPPCSKTSASSVEPLQGIIKLKLIRE